MIKKGELTTRQIVILIIVIVSFTIILILFWRLNLGEETDKELCRNSVIMRSNSILPTGTLPLNCKTSYLCFSGDGSCEKMTNPKIEKVETQDEVYEILAKQMQDCWWMFGEGKIDYVGKDLLSRNKYCSICTQIGFDDSLKNLQDFSSGTIDQKEFYENYLSKQNLSNKQITYMEYLYSGVDDISKVHSGGFDPIDLDKQYYIMMGIKSELNKWVKIVGTGVGVGIVTASFLTGAGLPVAVVALSAVGTGAMGAGAYVGLSAAGESGNEFLRPTILEANSKEFKALECEEVKTLA